MKKRTKIIILIIISISLLLGTIDFIRVKNSKKTLFCLTKVSKDLQKDYCYGLFYKIIKINQTNTIYSNNDLDIRFGSWLFTKKIKINSNANIKKINDENYIKELLKEESTIYNINLIGVADNDFYIIANDGPMKFFIHYKIEDNKLQFIASNPLEFIFTTPLTKTANTNDYAILKELNRKLYKADLNALKIEEITLDIIPTDIYVNKNTLVLIEAIGEEKKIYSIHIYDLDTLRFRENYTATKYNYNKNNNTLSLINLNNTEKTINLD